VATGADASMEWHDIHNPDDKLLDELAARYSLHQLHVEDCRQDAQRTKAETGEGYVFISLKQMAFDDSGRIAAGDLLLFVGGDFLLTVHRARWRCWNPCGPLKRNCTRTRCSIA
jgi:magnesium transporter